MLETREITTPPGPKNRCRLLWKLFTGQLLWRPVSWLLRKVQTSVRFWSTGSCLVSKIIVTIFSKNLKLRLSTWSTLNTQETCKRDAFHRLLPSILQCEKWPIVFSKWNWIRFKCSSEVEKYERNDAPASRLQWGPGPTLTASDMLRLAPISQSHVEAPVDQSAFDAECFRMIHDGSWFLPKITKKIIGMVLVNHNNKWWTYDYIRNYRLFSTKNVESNGECTMP